MLIFQDECIKRYPPQGTLLGSSRHSAEELVNTPTPPCWGISLLLGKASLAGDNLLCTRSAWGLRWGRNHQHTLRGKQQSSTCWGKLTSSAVLGETATNALCGDNNNLRLDGEITTSTLLGKQPPICRHLRWGNSNLQARWGTISPQSCWGKGHL